jgi:hypothetical protein
MERNPRISEICTIPYIVKEINTMHIKIDRNLQKNLRKINNQQKGNNKLTLHPSNQKHNVFPSRSHRQQNFQLRFSSQEFSPD